MDPLSAAASVIAVIQLATSVSKCIMSVAEASEDMTCLLEEVRTCKFVLEELKEKLDSTTTGQEWLITVQLLNKPEGPFKLLEDAFLTFKANYDAAKSKQNTVLKTWTKIKAPFYRPQVEKLLQILRSQIQLLHVALTNDSVRLGEDIYKTQQENSMVLTDLQKMVRGQAETSSNQLLEVQERLAEIHTVVRNTKDSQETERKRAILDWLTPCQYAAQQSDFVNRRTPATGQWLLSSEEFKQWSENEGQTLFCPGDPGAGKTILTSMVVEYLTTTFHQRETASVAHIYCDFRQRQEQKLVDLLASLLKQLCQIQAEAWLPDVVIELYNRHISKMSRPTATELSEALDHVSGDMSRTSRVFIIIDALDECHYNGGPLAPLLRILFDLQAHHRISIFATSRRIPDIERYFKDQPTEPICADRNDIEKYLNDCLRGYRGDLPSFVHNDEELQHDIKTSILDAAGGSFLLAHIQIAFLEDRMTVAAIRKALNDLRPHQVNPDGRRILPESDKQELLAHAYEQTMERIANHTQRRRELAMQALSWITFADGLLRKSELQHALAVESGKTALDQENVPRIEDIVSSCAGLVTVDEQSDIVRLVHYTAQEYLESTHCRWFPDAELAIVRTCISYLSLDVFGDISLAPKTLEELHVSYPLYSYASENWGYHARRLQGVCQEVVAFLQDESKVAGACHGQLGRFDLFIPPFTGLHLASYFGLHETMEILLETVLDADAEDYQSQTPLFYAVMENHESAVRALLGSGRVNAAHRDRWGQTVLSHLDGSDGAMLNLLVEVGGLDPDLKDDFGRTTMSRAATAGNDGLVRLLLDCHGADVNSRDINNRTPISYAAGAGSDNIVKMLLASGRAEADQIDREGRTPLSHAAEMGHKSVVDLLLACGQVEADRKDSLGRTPLSYAAMCGHAAIVALLMSRNDTDINSADKMRRTPLFYATASGDDRGEIVALLLARQDVDPNLHDLVGSTPLSVAARLGHTEMVKLLLGHPGVKPDCEDSFGRTALAWATREGKGEVVKLLASRLGESEGDVCTEEEEAADPIPDVEIGLHDSGLQRCFMCLRKIVGSQYWCERCVEWQPSPLCKECLGSGFGCPVGDGGHEQLLVFVPEL